MEHIHHANSFLSKRHILALISGAIIAISLAGCGGGGSKDVVVSKPGVALYTTAGENVSLEVGSNLVYKIGGGGGGTSFANYSVSSSNPEVLSVGVDGETLTLHGLKSGAAVVTVKDQAGASVEIKVTIGNSAALSILAPSTVNTQIGQVSSFKITGGTPPYTVVSSNIGVVSPKLNDAGDSIILSNLMAGGATIAVFDSKGATSTITATVTTGGVVAPLYTTSPAFISLSPSGAIPTYQLGGGTPPYSVVSSAPDVFEVVQTGSAYTVKGKALGFGSIAIKDAVGAVANISVSVVSGKVDVPFYSTAPSSIVLKQGATGNYSIAGGTSPYIATTSDQSVATVTTSGNNMTVTGVSGGAANISVKDALGASISFAVTVSSSTSTQNTVALYTSAPSDVTLQTSTTSTFTVGGGTGPYTATSSNSSVSTVNLSDNNLTINGRSLGTATVAIRDSLGAVTNIAVTVANPSTSKTDLFTTAPSAIVAKVGSTYPFSLTGGTSPYTATSSNPAVATVTISGSTVSILGVAVGTSSIVLKDNVGAAITIAVTVQ